MASSRPGSLRSSSAVRTPTADDVGQVAHRLAQPVLWDAVDAGDSLDGSSQLGVFLLLEQVRGRPREARDQHDCEHQVARRVDQHDQAVVAQLQSQPRPENASAEVEESRQRVRQVAEGLHQELVDEHVGHREHRVVEDPQHDDSRDFGGHRVHELHANEAGHGHGQKAGQHQVFGAVAVLQKHEREGRHRRNEQRQRLQELLCV